MNNIIRIELIENFIKERKFSKTKFCKLCKISPSTLRKILAGAESIYTYTAIKIAKALDVSLDELRNKEYVYRKKKIKNL